MSAGDKVFVSYTSADIKVARRIVRCLKRNYGDILWSDEKEIEWGDNIVDEINAGLRDSLMGIVILLSPVNITAKSPAPTMVRQLMLFFIKGLMK